MGIGVVVLDDGERQELGEYLGIGTNNIAELIAIERGLELVADAQPRTAARDAPRVRVYSDSGYAIGLLDKGWKAKANQELVARLRKRVAAVPISSSSRCRATPASPRTSAATSSRALRSCGDADEAAVFGGGGRVGSPCRNPRRGLAGGVASRTKPALTPAPDDSPRIPVRSAPPGMEAFAHSFFTPSPVCGRGSGRGQALREPTRATLWRISVKRYLR